MRSRQILSVGRQHPIDIAVSPASSEITVVTFHAALTSPTTALPVFAGASLVRPFDVNLVQVADPGLYADDELTVGWFAGTAQHPVQQELPEVLSTILKGLGTRKTVLFGASSGGFAALLYGRRFPDATIVCVNPQTILSNFTREHQELYCARAWGDSPEAVWGTAVQADLRDQFDGRNHNDIVYVQNERDPHLELHMEPFLASIPGDRVQVIRGDWGEGHQAPPADQLSGMLATLVQRVV
ncbi:alpha/beta hydrolase-fold protein [Kocuria palustris]|uniref:alpha/beta hydrolase-fold protein n=1 Tax=Kocuria palustris TaxID=71999 RepID=UPI00345017A4